MDDRLAPCQDGTRKGRVTPMKSYLDLELNKSLSYLQNSKKNMQVCIKNIVCA
jgi:hypothetical protein